jgi:hypothetical protein
LRDSQRAKVYRAERVAAEELGLYFYFADEDIAEMPELTAFVNKTLDSKRTRKAFAGARSFAMPVIKDGRRNRSASANAYEMVFPRWSRSRLVVMHELAHTLNSRIRSNDVLPDGTSNPGLVKWGREAPGVYEWKHAPHGWRFCMIYLRLVEIHIGKTEAGVLREAMKGEGVKFRKPRQISPDSRRELAERGSKALAVANG